MQSRNKLVHNIQLAWEQITEKTVMEKMTRDCGIMLTYADKMLRTELDNIYK